MPKGTWKLGNLPKVRHDDDDDGDLRLGKCFVNVLRSLV